MTTDSLLGGARNIGYWFENYYNAFRPCRWSRLSNIPAPNVARSKPLSGSAQEKPSPYHRSPLSADGMKFPSWCTMLCTHKSRLVNHPTLILDEEQGPLTAQRLVDGLLCPDKICLFSRPA